MLLSLISRCVLREPQNGVFSVTKREFVVVVSGFEIAFCHADVSVRESG